MTYLALILCVALAFFLGSIPFGLVIAKTFKGIDPRKAGSGNIGSTNVARLCGLPWGIMTLFCDIMKGLLPVLLAVNVLPDPYMQSLVALAAVTGHIKSPFLGFKGGKGVATTIGALIPLAFWPLLCAVLCCVAVIAVTRYGFPGLHGHGRLPRGVLRPVRLLPPRTSGRRASDHDSVGAPRQYRPSHARRGKQVPCEKKELTSKTKFRLS